MKKHSLIFSIICLNVFMLVAQEVEKKTKKWYLGLSYTHSTNIYEDLVEYDVNLRRNYYLAGLETSYRITPSTRLFGYVSMTYFNRPNTKPYNAYKGKRELVEVDTGMGVYTNIAKLSDKERLVFHSNFMFYRGDCMYFSCDSGYYLTGIELGLPGYSYNGERTIFVTEFFYKMYLEMNRKNNGFSFAYIGLKSSLLFQL